MAKNILLFSYGSIILPEMTKNFFNHVFIPKKSVFIKGYKLILEHANSKKYPNYHYILCKKSLNTNDLIPGFLVEIPESLIEKLDHWEGINYKRKDIICFDRDLKEIQCQIYIKND